MEMTGQEMEQKYTINFSNFRRVFRDSNLTRGAKLVLVDILLYAGTDGKSFPSQETIAKDFSYSSRHIRTCLMKLRDTGYVSWKRGGFGKSNRYCISEELYFLNDRTVRNHSSSESGTPVPLQSGNTLPPKEVSERSQLQNNTFGITKQSFVRLTPFSGKHRNQDIDFLIRLLKEKLELPLLDGSAEENRRYAWLLFVKFGKDREKAAFVIEAARQNEFWRTKIASMKSLYQRAVQLVSETRKGGFIDGRTKV